MMIDVRSVKTGGTVELKGLHKNYGGEAAVSDVCLTVAPGEFVSMIGPSGSGKTTTLMMIAGFVDPNAGSISINDADITRLAPQQRGLGMVFQNYAIFPHMTVFENIAFPLRVRNIPRDQLSERVNWALKTVKLEQFGGRYSKELSGGQQQRVALARAIVFHPSIVLMDEPLGALDKNLRYHMQVELKELQQRLGMTVIYVTHDQEEAMNLSDRIMVMNHGRVEQVGTPNEVYENPRTAFVARFLGEANLIKVIVKESHGEKICLLGRDSRPLASSPISVDCGEANLFVRPEKITISQAPSAPVPEGLTGRVSRISFLGNIIRIAVNIDDDEPVIVDRQNSDHAARVSVGDTVQVSWKSGDGRVISR